jgi:hypothetical protein
MTVLVYAKFSMINHYQCLFSQGQDSSYHEFCFGSMYKKMGSDIWAPGGRKTNSDTQVIDDFAIYSWTTKGPWLLHKNTMQIRVNMETKNSSGYTHTP